MLERTLVFDGEFGRVAPWHLVRLNGVFMAARQQADGAVVVCALSAAVDGITRPDMDEIPFMWQTSGWFTSYKFDAMMGEGSDLYLLDNASGTLCVASTEGARDFRRLAGNVHGVFARVNGVAHVVNGGDDSLRIDTLSVINGYPPDYRGTDEQGDALFMEGDGLRSSWKFGGNRIVVPLGNIRQVVIYDEIAVVSCELLHYVFGLLGVGEPDGSLADTIRALSRMSDAGVIAQLEASLANARRVAEVATATARAATAVAAASAAPEGPSTLCKICDTNPVTHTFGPCAHLLCLPCIEAVRRTNGLCPFCRSRNLSEAPVYFS